MTESSMFEKIISVDNLRKAWIKAYQYSRTDDVFFDEYAYSVFADHLEARLLLLSKELSEGTYQPSPLRYITIPKGNKERKIYFLSPKDTVVIQAVINIIGSDFEQTFINGWSPCCVWLDNLPCQFTAKHAKNAKKSL